MPPSRRAKINLASRQAGTGGEVRLPLKALDSVLKVKRHSAPRAVAGGLSHAETGTSRALPSSFSSPRAPQTARSAPAAARGRCRATSGCVCSRRPWSSWVYWLPSPFEASSPLGISCAGTWSGLGTWIKGGNIEVDHTNVVVCL